jgi:hypothetical protein
MALRKNTIQETKYFLKKPAELKNPTMKITTALCPMILFSLIYQASLHAQIAVIPLKKPSSSHTSSDTKSLKFASFNGSINKKKVTLHWAVNENQEADKFEVQSSADGKIFEMAALVFGTDNADTNDYQFFEKAKQIKTYYRVKIIGKNGSVSYSSVFIAAPAQKKVKPS